MNQVSTQLKKVASELKEGKANIVASPSKGSKLAKIAMHLRLKAFGLLLNK